MTRWLRPTPRLSETELRQLFEQLTDAARADAETSITPDRLSAQRERITRRLRRVAEGGPARVLRFPAVPRPAFSRVGRIRRWLGAAAVAGLVVGMAAGQFVHLHPVSDTASRTDGPAVVPSPTASEPTALLTAAASAGLAWSEEFPLTLPDDPLMAEVESMLERPQCPELSPIDEITPHIREVALNSW